MPANSEQSVRAFPPLALLPVCLSLALLSGCSEEVAKVAPPPPEVQVIKVEQKDVPIYSE